MFVLNDVYYIDRNSEVWDAVWGLLAKNPINQGDPICEDLETGLCWEYIGSKNNSHVFQHSNHPKTQRKENIEISYPM